MHLKKIHKRVNIFCKRQKNHGKINGTLLLIWFDIFKMYRTCMLNKQRKNVSEFQLANNIFIRKYFKLLMDLLISRIITSFYIGIGIFNTIYKKRQRRSIF